MSQHSTIHCIVRELTLDDVLYYNVDLITLSGILLAVVFLWMVTG